MRLSFHLKRAAIQTALRSPTTSNGQSSRTSSSLSQRTRLSSASLKTTKMDLRDSIANQTNFALALSNHVSRTCASTTNLVFSPISLHAILSIMAVGSKGPTRDQLVSFVRSKTDSDLNDLSSQLVGIVLADGSGVGGPRISFVNGVWVDESVSIKEGFKEIVTNSFRAEVKGADFQRKAVEVENEVNSWVEATTAGLIKELIPFGSINSMTRLVLGNALYFKGAWETRFDPAKTRGSEFFLLDKTSVHVPFMTSKEKQFISSYDDFSVLRLPYKRGDDNSRQLSMYIFLPHAKDGLWNLCEKLSSEPGFLDHHIPGEKVPVGDFKIPKLKISFGFEASGVLQDLGLVLPFSRGDGNLSEMVDSDEGSGLFVSLIFHKSFVEVNEEGTEAAGASVAVMFGSSMRPVAPLAFVADHPFVFMIREDMTGVVLFTGHVLNPLLSA